MRPTNRSRDKPAHERHRAPRRASRADASFFDASFARDPALFWNTATVYFLLTDRFANGDSTNDRGVDEGFGLSYAYHGYWTRDWTAVDPALGTVDDLRRVVDAAHRRGIRVLMDAVINHTGPATARDRRWPDDWVRAGPTCSYRDYVTTVTCNLVATLPDILTERDEPVDLPPALTEKWRREGRLDRELAELDAFFRRTGNPRAPRYYVITWLADWVRELGFDGYRVDTANWLPEARRSTTGTSWRALRVAGARGDAHLRSVMNWGDVERGGATAEVLRHWRTLGRFRRAHPAVGAGQHRRLQAQPYIFSRTLYTNGVRDRVLVAMDQGRGAKSIPVFGVFADGAALVDGYSGATGRVRGGRVTLTTDYDLVLLSERR